MRHRWTPGGRPAHRGIRSRQEEEHAPIASRVPRRRLAAGALALALAALALRAGAESPSGAPEDWPAAGHAPGLRWRVTADQVELRAGEGDESLRWDAEAWLAGAVHSAWLESEGELAVSGSSRGEAELQGLYGHALGDFWNVRAGVRQDFLFGGGPNRERTFAVLDLHGTAPFWIELTPALFLSDDGDLSARLTATSDWLLTQRLVAQPRFELNAAAHDARRFGVERGLTDLELGLRLRYELRRTLAPYVGFHWERRLGNSADLARDAGDDASELGAVAGLHFWF